MQYSSATILTPWQRKSRGLFNSALILALICLASCSSAPRELSVTTVPAEILRPEKPILPPPQPIQTQKIEWEVITRDTLPAGDFVFFALTPKAYEALSLNTADTLRWVTEAKWRLDYYSGSTIQW